jgi:hypothetical protein
MIYEQSTGHLLTAKLQLFAICYSGFGIGKNNPDMEHVVGVGPICQGRYRLVTVEYVTTSGPHGPYVIRLEPDLLNDMHGVDEQGNKLDDRAGFLIHGDEIHHPGTASHGCIVPLISGPACIAIPKVKSGRALREAIWDLEDRGLQVVRGASSPT